MANDFFDMLDANEKRNAKERMDVIIDLLEGWASQYSSIRTVRIPPLALHNATVMPRLDPSDSTLLAKLVLWIFGIDDVIDGGVVSLAELQQRVVEQWYLIANGGPPKEADGSDELARVLREIRKELSRHRLFEPLRECWANNVRLLAEAMTQEYLYKIRYNADGACALPSIDEYVQTGIYSTGIPLWALTLLIILNEPAINKCFELIDETAKCVGAAIRLYNDVQTHGKEVQENKVNSVVIKYHTVLDGNPGAVKEIALSEAKHQVLQMADSYAQRCYSLAKQVQTESRQFEEIVCRQVAFSAYFYGEHDYHTTPLAEVYEMLSDGTISP